VRFRRQFADLASLTDDLGDNPFPASIEVRVRPMADGDGRADALVERLAKLAGVVDVRYDREWITRLGDGLNGLRRVGLALVLLMALAAGVTVAAVVRLGLSPGGTKSTS
jgi:cell division protein FtsX